MSLREQWRELDTAVKVIIGVGVGFFVLVALIVVLVILAAVIGTFALGVGSTADASSPDVQFEVQYGTVGGSPAATITHSGGETIDADALQIQVGDRREDWPDDDGDVTPGEQVTVEVSPGTTLQVVWIGGDESAVLFEDDTPPEGNY